MEKGMKKGQKLKRRNVVTWSEEKRYRSYAARMQSRKSNRDGLVGISMSGKKWRTSFPYYLRIKNRSFKSAIEAAVSYNWQISKLFGKHAVLCDVNAAMEADRRCER